MIPSENCYKLIKKYEGFSSKPYKCPAGIPTIGYGSTFYLNGNKVTMKDTPISEEVALSILFSAVEDFSKKVEKLLKVPVNQNQFDALVDFSYNLGIGNFQKSTLLKLINNKDFIGASKQFKKWNKSNGKVLNGLTNRRKEEEELFLS